jgi:predicted nucleotidyltransferase
MTLTDTQARDIVDRLEAALHPEEIILFGSQAAGTADTAESDVDLCVVVPDDSESSYDKTVRAYRSLRGTGIPKDVIVRHRSRFNERARWSHSVEGQIAETGQRLYPR